MASQQAREWTAIQKFPVDTQNALHRLMNELKKQNVYSVTILVMGKGGVGKSSTVNSLLGERVAVVNAFQSEALRPILCSRTKGGFTLNIIDTPGLVEGGSVNDHALDLIKRFLLNKTVDILLYVDRLDNYRVDSLDKQVIRAITETFGQRIWLRSLLVLTHAQLSPPDGLSYTEFVEKRSAALYAAVFEGAGFGKVKIMKDLEKVASSTVASSLSTFSRTMNYTLTRIEPQSRISRQLHGILRSTAWVVRNAFEMVRGIVSKVPAHMKTLPGLSCEQIKVVLVENSGRCNTNDGGEKVLPDGTVWIPNLVENIVLVVLNGSTPISIDKKLIEGSDPNRFGKVLIPLVLMLEYYYFFKPMRTNAMEFYNWGRTRYISPLDLDALTERGLRLEDTFTKKEIEENLSPEYVEILSKMAHSTEEEEEINEEE